MVSLLPCLSDSLNSCTCPYVNLLHTSDPSDVVDIDLTEGSMKYHMYTRGNGPDLFYYVSTSIYTYVSIQTMEYWDNFKIPFPKLV